MPGVTDEILLDNHLAFLSRHRGVVAETATGYMIQSERPEFTYAIALRDGEIEPHLRVVHCPLFGAATTARLEAQGFRRAAALRYMTRETTGDAPTSDVEIMIATSRDDADVFADVQTRGFFDDALDQTMWLPFMRDVARRNIGDDQQAFLIGKLEGQPAGVTLTVASEAVVGVYAVATPLESRRRGIASALLAAALRRAAARGFTTATLQVAVGSEAERLYSHLGFESRFLSEIWRRT